MKRSLAGRLLLWLAPLGVAAIVLPLALHAWLDDMWLSAVIAAVLLLPLAVWVIRQALAPVNSLFRALSGAVNSYRDGEFNFGVHWNGNDELNDLVNSHEELGQVLRDQRQGLAQRELLLDSMVQHSPVAMLLLAPGGDGGMRVVFANLAARTLLYGGKRMEGQPFDPLLQHAQPELAEALERGGDSLFAVPSSEEGGEEQIYHLARRRFQLNGRQQELLQLWRLTTELRRQEVQTWKKVIRVISHELNNSLAPVASLAHSGGELVRRGRHDQLEHVFATIEERARHLEEFIRGYARFAKLPQPQRQSIEWSAFLRGLQQQIGFVIEGHAQDTHSRIDPAQFGQALLNLVKNAHESGGDPADVAVKVLPLHGQVRIEVLDRGSGMNEAVLQNALVPFYSTKRNGTGLGLALTREIIEAHDGRIALHNRDGGGLCVTLHLPLA